MKPRSSLTTSIYEILEVAPPDNRISRFIQRFTVLLVFLNTMALILSYIDVFNPNQALILRFIDFVKLDPTLIPSVIDFKDFVYSDWVVSKRGSIVA